MAVITHIVDGQNLGAPRNWQEIEFNVSWLLAGENDGVSTLEELVFNGKACEYINNRFSNGLSGGVGIFEGIPYEMRVGDPQSPSFIFQGYLDGTNDLTVLGGAEIVVQLKKRKGRDWLDDVADAFSFAYLAEQGIITNGDYIPVPYVRNFIPDSAELTILSVSIFMMVKESIEAVEKLAETIADVVDASTPVVGVGVGLGAVAVTSWDLGNFILVVLKAIARLAYLIAIVIAITKLIEDLFSQLLPAKKTYLGMKERTLFEKACQYLGLTFSSSIDDLETVIIPRKDGGNGGTGFPTNSGSMYSFADFILVMKAKYNADWRIVNNVFMFERRDSFEIPSGYVIPNYFTDQERLLNPIRYNTDEMVANYNITFEYDIQDQNTLQNQDGRVFQAITAPNVVGNEDLVNIKGLTPIAVPMSLGTTKTKLTFVEEVLKTLGGIVDAITGVFGGGTSFASRVEERVGSLNVSSDFLTFAKAVRMQGGNLAFNQREFISASLLWEKYHFIESFAEIGGIHNQYIRTLERRVPMSLEEFALLLDNNVANDANSTKTLIEAISYNPTTTSAVISYRVNQKYTNNLKITIL